MSFLNKYKYVLITLVLAIMVVMWEQLMPQLTHKSTVREELMTLPQKEATILYDVPVDSLTVLRGKIKKNERFIDILKGFSVAPRTLQQISLAPKEVFDFRDLRVGKYYTLLVHKDSAKTVKALVYEINDIDYVLFHLDDSLRIERCQHVVQIEEKRVEGIILHSLYKTVERLGLPLQITNQMVDIFAWQIDFQHLQKGDFFKLVYEEKKVQGETVSMGNIKAAYFDHKGQAYCAFNYYRNNVLEYFDEEGRNLRKTLLKYPIEFTRISSRYTKRRRHPLAKRVRSHLGVDFAAPTGTPIRSAGQGTVIEARYAAYNGNYVKIRHNDVYTTQYLHMSRIAPNIKVGVRVQKGQKIGYVGKTGLATGPHLCYRFWKNGRQVDALSVWLPPGAPVPPEQMPTFTYIKQELLRRMDSIVEKPYSLQRFQSTVDIGY